MPEHQQTFVALTILSPRIIAPIKTGFRLSGAQVRVGNDANFTSNALCPIPVSSTQIRQGQRITVACNLVGSYISVHLHTSGGSVPLTLCEVMADHGTCC